jgi:hypothetical protein
MFAALEMDSVSHVHAQDQEFPDRVELRGQSLSDFGQARCLRNHHGPVCQTDGGHLWPRRKVTEGSDLPLVANGISEGKMF